jgi:pilus assembly protein Flp/PilA
VHILSAVLSSFFARIRTRIGEERGASLVEYALLLALIALVCIGAITLIGEAAGDKLSSTTSGLR